MRRSKSAVVKLLGMLPSVCVAAFNVSLTKFARKAQLGTFLFRNNPRKLAFKYSNVIQTLLPAASLLKISSGVIPAGHSFYMGSTMGMVQGWAVCLGPIVGLGS